MRPLRALLAAFFALAGSLHFARPRPYESIVPPSLASRRREIVAISGTAELAGLDLSRLPRWLLWARLPVQPLLMLWVWRATR